MNEWTESEINILKECYGKFKIKDVLSKIPNRTISAIRYKAQEQKLVANREITNKRLECSNSDFFSVPNIINSYWAGFIAADGNIRNKTLTIGQSEIVQIEKFKSTIEHKGIISYRKRTNTQEYSISITSSKIIKDLYENYNIVERKTYCLKPPNINGINALSYIVGYLDGDGHISIGLDKRNNNKYLIYGILANIEMCEWMNSYLGRNENINKRKECKHLYRISGTHLKARKVLYMLNDIEDLKEIRLARKWNKVNYWKEKYGH